MQTTGGTPLDPQQLLGGLLAGRREVVVLLAMAPQQPTELAGALIQAARTLDVGMTVLFADLTGRMAFLDAGCRAAISEGKLRLVALAGAIHRDWHDAVDHYPGGLWDVEQALRTGRIPVDLVLTEMSGTPEEDSFSYGAMIGYTDAVLCSGASAVAVLRPERCVISDAPRVPRARFSAVLVAPARPVPDGTTAPISATQRQIAAHVAALIPDGATLQLGVGSLPDATIAGLAGKRDLGLHSGIITTSLEALLESGALTGRCKSLDRGRIVVTGVLGPCPAADSRLARVVRFRPISMTHDPRLLLAQDRLWAINSALEVDLSGQANAEYIAGKRLISGGGQSDFARAAHLSPGGGSIIALPATTGKGLGRIVANLPPGQPATTAAQDIDFVVTEFGTADLRGKTAAARRRALIAVAHPDHRPMLEAAGQAAPQAT